MPEKKKRLTPKQEELLDMLIMMAAVQELVENPLKLAIFKFQMEYAAERATELMKILMGKE